jgi:hypothetical protein
MHTPLGIASETGVSRPAIYAILNKLKVRGIVERHVVAGKKYWRICDARTIEEVLYDAKRALLQIPEGREEVHGRSDSAVIVHRGADAIKRLFNPLFTLHKHERFYGFYSDVPATGWNSLFTASETNRINRDIKEGGIIAEGITSEGFFEEQTKELGIDWAKDFEGRMARINIIGHEYFEHGGLVWIFKESLYLMALHEELVVEVRNSEIQKMILKMFAFMQDNSRTIDVNELLRNIIADKKKSPP